MEDTWELYYFPFAGRGEFIRLIFEEAGVKYTEISDMETVKKLVWQGQLEGFPAFAPPCIKKGSFVLSQAAICSKYLGKLFGFYPSKPEDEWHAEAFNATIHDFVAEGRLVFHARNFVESYYTQKEETKPYVEWFEKCRFDRWMGYLERCLGYNKDKNGFAIGDKLTYVDLGLLQVLRAAESSFPNSYKPKIDNYPLLKAHRERIENRPRLQEYFKSSRSRPMGDNSMM